MEFKAEKSYYTKGSYSDVKRYAFRKYVVIDSSALFTTFSRDESKENSVLVLEALNDKAINKFIAPILLKFEFGNFLAKSIKANKITISE